LSYGGKTAGENGQTLDQELALLVVHGTCTFLITPFRFRDEEMQAHERDFDRVFPTLSFGIIAEAALQKPNYTKVLDAVMDTIEISLLVLVSLFCFQLKNETSFVKLTVSASH
jgi:hypothetical protein